MHAAEISMELLENARVPCRTMAKEPPPVQTRHTTFIVQFKSCFTSKHMQTAFIHCVLAFII